MINVIPRAAWKPLEEQHQARLRPVVDAHRARRHAGIPHPVIDFLFRYYNFRTSTLLAWTPGVGVLLEDGRDTFRGRRHFSFEEDAAFVDTVGMKSAQRKSSQWILELLEATHHRPPHLGCHGLHEWAMVYRIPEVRHASTPLRLGPDHIRQVVESAPLTCTHFDAFRFFTPEAKPLNKVPLGASGVHSMEQPGCLHANMDIYRWAMKRHPWIESSLIADAFELALEIREVDMRASPYDLSGLGYEPIPIETESGKEEYRQLQSGFHQRAQPLRERLIASYGRLLDSANREVTP